MNETTRTNVSMATDEQTCPSCLLTAPTVDTETGTPVTQGFTVESRCRDCGALVLARMHWPTDYGRMAQYITRFNADASPIGVDFEGWVSSPKPS